jgi:hypothetical protein
LNDANPTPEPLQQAAAHLRQGEFEAASRLLAIFLQEHPDSADGWVLFSYALDDPVRKLECVERALQLQPGHAQAAVRMQELKERHPGLVTDWAGREGRAQPDAASPRMPTSTEPRDQPGLAEAEPEAPIGAQTEPPAASDLGRPQVAPFTVPVADSVGSAVPGEAPLAFMAGLGTEPEAEGLVAAGGPSEAQGATTAASDQATAEQPEESVQEPARRSRIVVVLAGLFGCAVVAGAIGLLYSLFSGLPEVALPDPTLPAVASTTGVTAAVASPVVLPPSWTPSSTPTVTPTRTPEPTHTPTSTATLVPPNATQLASMGNIGLEVADLRGLGFQGTISAYLVPRLKARALLEEMYRSAGGSEAQLEDYKRELVALGLVKPTYDLIDTVLNSLADAVGGFYDPISKRLFIIGGGMGAVERFVYSHEFAHALVDQHYPFDRLGAYPVCQSDQDHCRAITGLVEGDATLVMNQWMLQYAGPQDLLELLDYTPPPQALPEQFPPPFAIKDGEFPYQHGRAFVQALHDRGNWAEVNRAYTNLPLSSEQILHPEKYFGGERPQDVRPPALEGLLGAGWRLVASDTLGEWGTYLLLGYSADLDSQLLDGAALYAAQGWGGDRYQVYVEEASDRVMLAALWRWDSEPEAVEFLQALHQHLNSRFRGQVMIRGAGACWQGVDQVSCIYQRGASVLWILAPDEPVLDAVLGAYPGFP